MKDRSPLYPNEVLHHSDGRRPSRARSGLWMVVDSWRRRPVPRRILGLLSIGLLVAGVLVFSWPFLTNLYADWKQRGLEKEFGTAAHRRAYVTRTIEPGHALTRIRVPALGVESIVVEGTSLHALQAGAGHYARTALPCEKGNAAIAGHRTTYSKPFANLQDLGPGDRVVLETPVGRCTYRVTRAPWITFPKDVSVLRRMTGSWLTLTTCNPPGSAVERLVVRAKLVSSRV